MVGTTSEDMFLYDELRKEFTERFACWLGISGMTQSELAAKMKRHRQQINEIAVGDRLPTVTMINMVAKAMEIRPEHLFPTGNDDWRKTVDFHAKQASVIRMGRSTFTERPGV